MSVRIALACSDRRVAEQFRTLLAENVDMELTDVLEDGRDLLTDLDRTEAEILVLHEGLGPVPALEMVREVALARPYLGVVLLAVQAGPEVYAHAMEAGARSVISAPFSLEEVTDRIDAAASWSRSVRSHLAGDSVYGGGRRGRLVSVSGAKGGVGTTLIAGLLATSAQRSRQRVCIVDFDLQNGDLGVFLGVQTRRSVLDLAEVAAEISVRSLNEIAYRHPSGLHVLVAPEHGEHAEDMTARSARLILSALRMQYDLVVVDCGAHVDDAVAVAVEHSDPALLVVTPDVPSLRAARRRLDLWERLQIAKPDEATIVLNRVSRRVEIQPDVAGQILGKDVAQPVVPAAFREIEDVVNAGNVTGQRNNQVVRAVRGLAEELELVPSAPEPDRQSRRRRARTTQSGQSIVETPVIVGLLLMFVLVLFQMLVWGWTHVVARNAAHEAARAASVQQDSCAAARDVVTLGWAVQGCPTVGSGQVEVTVTTPTIVPFLGDLPVVATTGFVAER